MFFDKYNQKLFNESQLERIKDLVFPAAWKDVWISPKTNTYLQAT
ncbi:hypothetical protein [Algoriphagus persicinus]